MDREQSDTPGSIYLVLSETLNMICHGLLHAQHLYILDGAQNGIRERDPLLSSHIPLALLWLQVLGDVATDPGANCVQISSHPLVRILGASYRK